MSEDPNRQAEPRNPDAAPDAPRPAAPVGPRGTGAETGDPDADQQALDNTNDAPRPATPTGPGGTGAETGTE